MPRSLASLLALTALAAAPWGCRRAQPPAARPAGAEIALLERQVAGLRELVALDDPAKVFSPDLLAVGVAEGVVRQALDAALPVQRVIGGANVRLEQATLNFASTQAALTVTGRVALADKPDTFADLSVYGGLDHLEVDPETGTLAARIGLDGFEVHRAAAAGTEADLVTAALEALGERRIEELQSMIPVLRLPVALEKEVTLDALGDGPVTIKPARLPIGASVARVLALSGRLWVLIDVKIGAWEKVVPPARDGRS